MIPEESPGFTSTLEADTHADTCVAGKNCVPLHYTDRTCDVQPYSDEYKPVTNIPIVTAATGYTSKTGLNYILVIPEAIYMPSLSHSLFNPNQFRHFGTIVQDNPFSDEPMVIRSEDGQFTACLQSKGTDIFLQTWAPSLTDLTVYPHIVLCSTQPWNPQQIELPSISRIEQEEVERTNEYTISTTRTTFDINEIRRMIMSVKGHSEQTLKEYKECRRISALRSADEASIPLPETGPIEESEIRPPHTFLSRERHSRTTPEELSERWGLSISQAKLTLKATTRNLVRSALMPLARRYRVDRMFQPNRIEGTFATDTMDMRCKSIHGEQYCQVFANKEFFAETYPIEKK